MDQKSHEEISMAMFGSRFSEVHTWLDECFEDYGFSGRHSEYGSQYFHWIERHHLEAIEKKYGLASSEYQVAKLHIIIDWVSHWGKVHLPKDSRTTEILLRDCLGLH